MLPTLHYTSEVNVTVVKWGNRQIEAMTFRGNLRTGRSEMATLTSRPPLFPHAYWTEGWENPRVVVGAFMNTISFCVYRDVNTDGAACNGSLTNEFMLQFSGLFSMYFFWNVTDVSEENAVLSSGCSAHHSASNQNLHSKCGH
jgi:hypothetical protein